MARSSAYDKWEDPGLAFSEDEVAEVDPIAVAVGASNHIRRQVQVCVRRTELNGLDKPGWWSKAAKRLRDKGAWLHVAVGTGEGWVEVVGNMPSPKSKEGKALTQVALEADEASWLAEEKAWAETIIREWVTLARRAGGVNGWKKQQWSRANKLTNGLVQYYQALELMEEKLESMPNPGSKDKINDDLVTTLDEEEGNDNPDPFES